MPNDDREQRFDQALARHLPGASPDSSCPDAEILAAYHERTLSTGEMSHWKEHIAACNRCQETLALVEQTENLPAAEWEHQNQLPSAEQLAGQPVVRASAAHALESAGPSHAPSISAELHDEMNRLHRRPSWRLLVALGAIAATVIVWIGAREVRMQHREQAYETQLAQNRVTMPPLPVPQTESRSNVKKEALAVPKLSQELPAQRKTASPSSTSAEQRDSALLASAASANNSAITEQEHALTGTTPALGTTRDSSAASGSIAQDRSAAPATSPNAAGTAGASPNGSAEAKQPAGALARATAESLEVKAPPVNATSAQMELRSLPAGNLLQRAAGSHRYVVAPGEAHGWILGAAGEIMHTTDRGKTWKPQISGVIADLTTGSATSDKVCWVAGTAGTLLLTTDGGQHWKLLSSPIAGDLGGVHATDAMRASIWDVPNRTSYQTSDGGVTWQRTANE
jgi:Photosynthesis system II assembly factor YCF48